MTNDNDNTEFRFDPRHDPIYQRGYQQDAARPTVTPPRGAAHPPDVAPRLPEIAARPEAEPAAGQDGTADPAAAAGPAVTPPPAADSPRNPYFLALWIIAAFLIVAGFALEWRSVALADYGYASAPGEVPLEAIIQQLTWVLAPIMITVGASTMVALLFWRGMHWRPGRDRPGNQNPGTDLAGEQRGRRRAASWY